MLVDFKGSIVADFVPFREPICIKTALSAVGTNREFARRMRPPREACLLLDYGPVRSMPIGDSKTLDHYRNVLIVEKNPNYTQALVKQILSAGLKPIVAITGEGGLRMAEECHPDLILLEVELPDMNGLRFVSAIRRNPEADRVPIVAMSAFPDLKGRCLERGCNDFLLKPVRIIAQYRPTL